MNKLFVMTMAGVLAACGGESTEERICGAANGCGALAAGNVDACVEALGAVDADRALEECATCLETKTCAEIADGACAPTCSAASSVLGSSNGGLGSIPDSTKLRDLDPSELADVCHEGADVNPKRTVECTQDGRTFTVIWGIDRATCGSLSLPGSCNATVGQFRDCNEMTGGISDSQLCTATPPAACVALQGC